MGDMNAPLFAAQVIVAIFAMICIVLLACWTLLRLREDDLPQEAMVLWAALIIFFPVLGALAYFYLRSSGRNR